jgi:hypothetical protein
MESKIEGRLHDAMDYEFTPKFLATVDEEGKPNVVLIATMEPGGETRMNYADFLMNKTAKNLDGNSKAGVLVITEQLAWWSMLADHAGWEEKGPLVDHFNSTDLFRYNAYTGVRRVGMLALKEILDAGTVGKLGLLTDFTRTLINRASFGKGNVDEKMTNNVREKFARIQAVKVLSWVREDGYPVAIPVLSIQPASSKTLVFSLGTAPEMIREIPAQAPCAVNVVTFEPVSYQVKGTFTGFFGTLLGRVGVIEVDSVWCTSPPLCGERIDADLLKTSGSCV